MLSFHVVAIYIIMPYILLDWQSSETSTAFLYCAAKGSS